MRNIQTESNRRTSPDSTSAHAQERVRRSPQQVICTALRVLAEPEQVFELRAFVTGWKGRKETILGYFNDHEKAAKAAADLDRRGTEGVYVTLNPVMPALLARADNRTKPAGRGEATKDEHILRRRWLPVDVDPERPAGISATDEEKEAAFAVAKKVRLRLEELGFAEPVRCDSGNGAHLPYYIDLPAEDDTCERLLKALAVLFNTEQAKVDTAVHNPSRIWKLYGTHARKGDATEDRPHRQAKILHVPEPLEVTPPETLEAALHVLEAEAGLSSSEKSGSPQRLRKAARTDAFATSAGDPEADVREVLSHLRGVRPGYDTWVRIIAGTLDKMRGDVGATEQLLKLYLPEEEEGEYARKLASPLEHVTFASVVEIAKQYGYDPVEAGRRRATERLDEPAPRMTASTSSDGMTDGLPAPPAEKGAGWGDPQPVHRGLPSVPPLNPALLPPPFRAWAVDVARRVQAPLDFMAAGMTVTAASALGRRCGIRPMQKDDWLVIPNLWGGIVGGPSAKKSPTLKQCVYPLAQLHRQEKDVYTVDRSAYDAERTAYDAEVERLKKQLRDADNDETREKAKEALQAKLADPPTEPLRLRYYTNDATVEKLAEYLQESRQLLVLRDELTGLIAGMERSGQESARSFYLEGWNGDGTFEGGRIGRGDYSLDGMCLSLLGGVQPDPLQELVRPATGGMAGGDGFIQRFQILVWPDDLRDFEIVDEAPDRDARDAYEDAVRRLATGSPIDDFGAEPDDLEERGIPFLRFDADAQPVFFAWLERLERRLRSGQDTPAVTAHLGKYRSLVPSLALLFHLVDGRSGPVQEGPLRKAIAFTDYLEAHARRVYGAAADPAGKPAVRLAEKIASGSLESPFTQRDVYRKGWTGLSQKSDAHAACERLVGLAWLRGEEVSTGGRPTTHYYINPALLEDEVLTRRLLSRTATRRGTPTDELPELTKGGKIRTEGPATHSSVGFVGPSVGGARAAEPPPAAPVEGDLNAPPADPPETLSVDDLLAAAEAESREGPS